MQRNDDSDKSVVIPNWLEVSRAAVRKELAFPRATQFMVDENTRRSFLADLKDYNEGESAYPVAHLLGSASLLGEEKIASELAAVLSTQQLATPVRQLVDSVMQRHEADNFDAINDRISAIRGFLRNYPRTAFKWLDLARLYTIKGQIEPAKKAIATAINLSPHDRHIARSTARFFLHIDDPEVAYFYIKRASAHNPDPWLKSVELSLMMLLGKRVGKFHRLVPSNPSHEELFQYSELIENVGMLELDSGNRNRAKKHFRLAWKNPSEGVVRHGEWVLRNRLPTMHSQTELDFTLSTEALAWRRFLELDLSASLQAVREWELEEPYLPGPAIMGSAIACHLDQPDEGVEFAKRGLIANPQVFSLRNNLVYAYLRAGRIQVASVEFKRLPSPSEESSDIFRMATEGLLLFKMGRPDDGRELYNQAIKASVRLKETKSGLLATLHLAIAECEAGTPRATETAVAALALSKTSDEPNITMTRKRLMRISGKGVLGE